MFNTLIWISFLCVTNIQSAKEKASTPCPGSNYAQLADTCYYFYDNAKTWWNAELFCEENGGTLLIFQEKDEIKLVKKEIKKIAKNLQETAQFWLGLKHNADDDKFYWSDGSDLTRKNWINKLDDKIITPGQCVVIQAKENSGAGAKKWETKSCEEKLPFVCEIELSMSRWSVWSSWGECSSSCGPGRKSRSRKCLRPTSASDSCSGISSDTSSCNKASCPDWSEWSNWGSCSVSCGEGKKERSRQCLNSKRGSDCSGSSKDTASCTQTSCPEWSEWSNWGSCSVSCGEGKKERSRQCLNSKRGSDCSGSSKDTASCTQTSCPDLGDWSNWGSCSATCGEGKKKRSRQCLNSKRETDCSGSSEDTTSCTQTPCPDWTEWSNWGSCSVSCGEGKKERSRQCLNSKRGSDCSGSSKDTTSCTQTPCPDWSDWSNWGSCSATCGEGKKKRSRQCLNSKRETDCSGSSEDTTSCTQTPCPEWSEWSDWNSCSSSCGEGQQTRSRRCMNSINNGECKGNSQITRSCSQADCPDWSVWSKWSTCSVTCGEGKRERQRKCLNSKLGSNCRGNSKDTTACVQAPCPDWTEWSNWSSCSVTCGEGKKERSRKCSNSKRGSDCSGNSKDTTSCTQTSCPDWSDWSNWGSCSATCGEGKRERSRRCLNSKRETDCSGSSEDTTSCTQTPCPEWSEWSDWNSCSSSCGEGQQTRSRRCMNSINIGECKGNSQITRSCSMADCPDWSEWSKWSTCSVTCGEGKRERQRKCLNSKLGSNCKGNSKDTTACVQAPCPDWSEWTNWGSCSVSCGEGKKERSRQCLNSKRGSDCSGSSKDTTSCTQTPCPGKVCPSCLSIDMHYVFCNNVLV
ncbi:A disintegrin and metalloproteinase with thrombospondin motifs adt-1 [Patella vulgata]|uniref:A disintegrin and metalloproteinase with thrombospondin motifs adt-1 n=1 Tax=Patella vulgata TaxID=6465 RepID=UPI0024A8726F|nr:A disintegrin and metalloproteinase with thrombospondin motifs adt-1 [Patella vulgata]